MPEHLDFIKHLGLNAHALACEFSLISDNLARGVLHVNVADSIALTYRLLDMFRCGL